jgi:hypothetical protein
MRASAGVPTPGSPGRSRRRRWYGEVEPPHQHAFRRWVGEEPSSSG